MLKLSFKDSCNFFHWKIPLHLNLLSISVYHADANGFLKLDCSSSFLPPKLMKKTVTDVNKVPVRALVLYRFVGIRESIGVGWGYRGGETIWFRWFKTETDKRSAVCIATGIAMQRLHFTFRDSSHFGVDVKAPKWKIHSILGGLFCFSRQRHMSL